MRGRGQEVQTSKIRSLDQCEILTLQLEIKYLPNSLKGIMEFNKKLCWLL